jgi:hypothetical protein
METYNDFLPGLLRRSILPDAVLDMAVALYGHRHYMALVQNPILGARAHQIIGRVPKNQWPVESLIKSGNPSAIEVVLRQEFLDEAPARAILHWWVLNANDWERFLAIIPANIASKLVPIELPAKTAYHGDNHTPCERNCDRVLTREEMRGMTLDDWGCTDRSLVNLAVMLADEMGDAVSTESERVWRYFFNLAETRGDSTLGEALDVATCLALCPTA